jgi:branched-chain amino acid transport system substrate-binding protein
MSLENKNTCRVLKRTWQLACLMNLLFLVAVQCSAPTPPLPARQSVGEPVRVAVLTPMTGEFATFGEMVRNGITLAFDEWNDQGGVNGQPIEWVLEDTRCDPIEAASAAERAIDEQGARFIVGGVCSEAAIPIARVVEERGALFIATTATHPLVTIDGADMTRSGVFRASFAYPYQGRAAALFALDDLNACRAAVLTHPVDDFVRSLGDEFTDAFVAGGGEVVAAPTYLLRDSDFETIIAEVAEAAPDVLYVPDAYPVANRVGSQVRTQGLDVILIGSELWNNSGLDLEALEGAYFTSHFSRQAPNPVTQAWAERYISAFAVEPDTLAALGYDAAGLVALGIEESDSALPDEVARSLESIEFEGVTGRWRFDTQHNPLKPVVVFRIEGGDVYFYNLVSLDDG